MVFVLVSFFSDIFAFLFVVIYFCNFPFIFVKEKFEMFFF